MMRSYSVFLCLIVAGVIAACGERGGGAARLPVPIDRYREVEDFSFTNQEAETVTGDVFAGKVWVADFVFTSCGAECLVLSQKMAAVQNRYADRDDVAFASFSVDPQTDRPERLAGYGKRWGADFERWQFFTGDPAKLDSVIKQSFLLPVTRSPGEKAKLMTASLVHSNKLAIVDRQGVVRAYVDGLRKNAIDEVCRVIDTLLAEPVPPPNS